MNVSSSLKQAKLNKSENLINREGKMYCLKCYQIQSNMKDEATLFAGEAIASFKHPK